jgi:uncharacterized membrane protein
VADVLREALALYRRHFRVLLLTAAILYVPASIITNLASAAITAPLRASSVQLERVAARSERLAERAATGQLTEDDLRDLGRQTSEAMSVGARAVGGLVALLLRALATALVAFILWGLVTPLTQGALTIAIADRFAGGQGDWRQYWGLVLRRAGALLAALVPASILIAIGMAMLVIPGLVLGFLFSLVTPVVLIEGVTGVAALKRSVALVRSDWLRIALVFVVFFLIALVSGLVAGVLVPSSLGFVGGLLGNLITLVLLPLPILAIVFLYLDLRRRSEGLSGEDLANTLGGVLGR